MHPLAVVEARVVCACCVLHLSQTRVHHKYQSWFLWSGIFTGNILGTPLQSMQGVQKRPAIAYVAVCALIAQVASATLHSLPSWLIKTSTSGEASEEEDILLEVENTVFETSDKLSRTTTMMLCKKYQLMIA